jgi:hypothetical protein
MGDAVPSLGKETCGSGGTWAYAELIRWGDGPPNKSPYYHFFSFFLMFF